MFCYKDRWFCTHKDCTNLSCTRNTNREDFQPDGMPVSYMTPDCPDYIKDLKDESNACMDTTIRK